MLFWLFIAAAAALLVLLVGCGGLAPAAAARVEEGAGLVGVVTLDRWGLTVRRDEKSWTVCRNFDLRVLDEGGSKSLLIRGKNYLSSSEFGLDAGGRLVETRPARCEYSDDWYAVSLGGSFAVRKVGPAEWARGRELSEEEKGNERRGGATRKFFPHEGKTLPEGGATRGGLPLTLLDVSGDEMTGSGWLLSQAGRYVAAFSHTSRRRPYKRPSLIPFSGEDDRIAGGLMYVDFFDGETGRRLARASKGHNGSHEFYVGEQAVWFEGRYFAMPLDGVLGVWLVGAFPG
jgi:hypothetical protein